MFHFIYLFVYMCVCVGGGVNFHSIISQSSTMRLAHHFSGGGSHRLLFYCLPQMSNNTINQCLTMRAARSYSAVIDTSLTIIL